MHGTASTTSSRRICIRSWYNLLMPRVILLIAATAIAAAPGFSSLGAALDDPERVEGPQTRKTTPARRPAPAAALTKVEPDMMCPAPLGTGVRTKLSFCEVLAGRDPAGGLLIRIPPHKGPAALS